MSLTCKLSIFLGCSSYPGSFIVKYYTVVRRHGFKTFATFSLGAVPERQGQG